MNLADDALCDLHLHSTASDGSMTPKEVVRSAHAAGMRGMALTDHDTVAGFIEARREAEDLEIEILSGVEISAVHDSNEVHILGYDFDVEDRPFCELLDDLRERRNRRIPKIVTRLNEIGIPIQSERVFAIAENQSPGRPHIARVLVELEICRTTQEAFDRYLGDGKPAHLKRNAISAEQAISAIHAAGGIASLAHPAMRSSHPPGGLSGQIESLRRLGLDALEVHHPSHLRRTRRNLKRLARHFELLMTGGSDCHGDGSPGVAIGRGRGDLRVPFALFDALQQRNRAESQASPETGPRPA